MYLLSDMVEYVTKTFHCPNIRSQADAELISETLYAAPEINECTVDVPDRKVTIEYAEALNESEVKRHLSSAGFPAEEEED